jgi:thiol-disulfide isomerase/thioredoxin
MKLRITHWILGVTILLTACTGYVDDEIVIRVDKTEIVADGEDAARFRIEFRDRNGGNRDVTTEATITETGSGRVIEGGIFRTETPGIYTFTALFSGIPATLPIRITALAPQTEKPDPDPDPVSGDFYRRVGIVEFTGTWCTYCPDMAAHISGVEALYPDRSVVLAVHVNGTSPDPLATPQATALINKFRVVGLPAASIDFGPLLNNTNTNSTDLARRIREIVESGPAECGLAIETSSQGGIATAKVKLRAAQTEEFNIAVALVEDGITGQPQTMPDGSKQSDYLHNHTLRKFYQDNIEGITVGEVAAGEQVERDFAFDLAGYNAANCRFVVFATSVVEGQAVMVNAAECKLGENMDFQYEKNN